MGDLNQERSIEIVGAQSKFQAPSPSYPFTLDEGEFSLNVDDNFNFYVSSPSFLMPISPKLKVGLKDLENHLTDHKDQTLTIIGHHSSKEENNTPYENLGLARANSVKNQLVLAGISSGQIVVLGKLDDTMVQKEEIVFGPISYSLTKKLEENQP